MDNREIMDLSGCGRLAGAFEERLATACALADRICARLFPEEVLAKAEDTARNMAGNAATQAKKPGGSCRKYRAGPGNSSCAEGADRPFRSVRPLP